MTPELPAERGEACRRRFITTENDGAHHALIARLRAQVVEQRQRAEMAEGVANATNEELQEARTALRNLVDATSEVDHSDTCIASFHDPPVLNCDCGAEEIIIANGKAFRFLGEEGK